MNSVAMSRFLSLLYEYRSNTSVNLQRRIDFMSFAESKAMNKKKTPIAYFHTQSCASTSNRRLNQIDWRSDSSSHMINGAHYDDLNSNLSEK